MSDPLPHVASGRGRERAVLLHGFGGSARTSSAVVEALGDVPSVAFDLPGHGAAVSRDDLTTVEARNAVIAELERHGIERAHLVGHSRGGAIACLVAAKVSDRIASLTLVAPGGFGEEIASDALAAFAAAETEDELRAAMTTLYAPARPSCAALAEEVERRHDPRVRTALATIREGMTSNGKQGLLRLDGFAVAPYPITVLWGDADAVLPVGQAHAIANADVHILEGRGHMLPAEAPRSIADAVRSQFWTNRNASLA